MIEDRSHTGTASLPYAISDAVLNHVTLKIVCHNLYTTDNKEITSIMHFEGMLFWYIDIPEMALNLNVLFDETSSCELGEMYDCTLNKCILSLLMSLM